MLTCAQGTSGSLRPRAYDADTSSRRRPRPPPAATLLVVSPLSRRRFLGATLAAAGAVAVSSVAGCANGNPGGRLLGAAPRPLAIPPLAPSTRDAAGRRVVELVAAPGTSSFLPGVATPTWGYGGLPFGGPTVRVARGDDVVLRVTNRLPETTTTHWHGASVPARADGGPHQPIAPGATWEASWRVDQPAATLWYHPHPHGQTERHVHRGLFGLFLVDDDVPTRAAVRLRRRRRAARPHRPQLRAGRELRRAAPQQRRPAGRHGAGQRHGRAVPRGHHDPDAPARPQRLVGAQLPGGLRRRGAR